MKRRYKPNVFRDIYEQPYSDVGVTRMKLYKSSKNSLGMVQRLDLMKRLPVHNGCVNSISWNETGDYILSGSDDQHLVISHGFNHKVLTKFKTAHRANIFSAKFLPGQGDRHIVSCSGDGTILFTDLNRPQSTSSNKFACHLGTTYDVVTVPNDSHSFLSCGEDGTVRWFDLRIKEKCLKVTCRDDIMITCERAVTSLSLNPTAPYQLAVGCSDSRVRLFDRRMLGTVAAGYLETARTCRPLCTFTVPALKERSCRITSLNYSPDGEEILVSFSSDLLYLFSMRDQSGGDNTIAAGDCDVDGPSSERSPAPVRRLRLRGDWSDTGPNARPERDGGSRGSGEFIQTRRTLHSSLMQRMTDVLSRMLNDPATRANLNSGRQTPRAGEEESDAAPSSAPQDSPNVTPQRLADAPLADAVSVGSPRSPVFPFEHPLNESFSVNPFLPLNSPLSPDPEPEGLPNATAHITQTTPAVDVRDTLATSDPTPGGLPSAPGIPPPVSEEETCVLPTSPDQASDDIASVVQHIAEVEMRDSPVTPDLAPDNPPEGDYCPSALRNASQPSESSIPCACDSRTLLLSAHRPHNDRLVPIPTASHIASPNGTVDPPLPPPDQPLPSLNSLNIAQQSAPPPSICCQLETLSADLDSSQPKPARSDNHASAENGVTIPCEDVGQDYREHLAEYCSSSSTIASAATGNISLELVTSPEESPPPPVEPRNADDGGACPPETEMPRFTLGDPRAKMELVDPLLDENFRRDSPLSPPLVATESVAIQATDRGAEAMSEDETDGASERGDGGRDAETEDSDGSGDVDGQQFPRVMYPRPRQVMIPPGDITQLRNNEDLIDTLHSMRHRHATEPAVLLSVSDVTETGAAFAVRLATETNRGPPDIPFLPQHQRSREVLARGLAGDAPSENRRSMDNDDDEGNDDETEDTTPNFRVIHPIEREMDEAIAGARLSGVVSEERSSFQPSVKQVFSGHRNARTMIKEACFWGTEYVMSGSDCGHVFVWERSSGRLVQLFEGDDHVVNCLQPHPTLPVLATSGIDYDVKLWAPLAADSTFDVALADMLKKRNEIMLEETKDTITVPATFMIRMLACLNQIRRGGRRNRRTDDDESNE